AVADLAAPIHGVPKDELESEDLRQHRRARRLARTAVAALVLLVVVSLLFGGYALVQRNRATDDARRASRSALLADSGRLAAQAQLLAPDHLDLSLLLAAQGRRLVTSDDTDGGLEAVLARVPNGFEFATPIPVSAGPAGAAPDGRLVAIPGTDDRVYLVDTATWQTVRTLEGFRSGAAGAGSFRSDGGRRLAAGRRAATQ